MANWEVKAYLFGHYAVPGQEHWISVRTITDVISGKLTMTLNDTSKLTITVRTSWYSDIQPSKTLLEVKHGNDRKFFGTVTKITKDVVNGTTKVDAVGVLGSYQFLPNYRGYADSIDLNGIIECESKRYLGEYQSSDPQYIESPWVDLFTPKGEGYIPSDFGRLSMSSYPSMHTTCNLDKAKRNAKNAYDFLKTITKENNYCLPTELQNPTWFKWVEYGEQAEFKPISGVNTQSISYKANLMSCTMAVSPYKTRVRKYYNMGSGVQGAFELTGTEYPIPYYYDSSTLPNKDDGSPYIIAEVQKAVQNDLDERSTLVEATAFDAHLVDNTIPWLDMGKYVNVVYHEGSEETAQAQITQIEYDLVDSSRDRVKLGRIVSSITDSLGTSPSDLAKQIEEYLPRAGGQMTGAITYDGGTSLDENKLKIRDRYAFTGNLLDKDSMVQGGILTDSGLDYPTPNALRSPFIKVSPSTTYTYSNSLTPNGSSVRYYAADKSFIGTSAGGVGVFNTPSNCYYVRCEIWYGSYVVPSSLSWAQLEKGSSASNPLPYTMDAVEVADALRNLIPFIASGIHFSKPIKTLSSTSVSVTISDFTDTDGWFAVVGDSNGAITFKMLDIHASTLGDGGWILPNSRDITVSISGNTLTISGYPWSTLHIISSNFVVL
jgi:hypothetical protein